MPAKKPSLNCPVNYIFCSSFGFIVNSLKKGLSLNKANPGISLILCANNELYDNIARQLLLYLAYPLFQDKQWRQASSIPDLVQMLLVAFSRLICCSRVCNVNTKQRFPSLSIDIPEILPGNRRKNLALCKWIIPKRDHQNSLEFPALAPRQLQYLHCTFRVELTLQEIWDWKLHIHQIVLMSNFFEFENIFEIPKEIRILNNY